ncbi:unnamed protein product [Rhizoctonia solani]|uniref:Uncharacterized protein n=1 Tax=Rhizoctonia solani TaxID=456999 RepID=A0A8H3A8Y0_9AGAM|nr:unnamed protein product [Rhizoctonia solani]
MSVVQTVVGWGVTAYSLVLSTRGSGDSSANCGPEYSDTATRALAGAGEQGNQVGQMDSLADSLAKAAIGDSKASKDGTEREITSVNSDPQIGHDHTTPEDKSANKEPVTNSKRNPSTILAETEVGSPNVESNLLQKGQVESSLTTASTQEHETDADPTQQGGRIVQAEAEPDEKSASKTSIPELLRKHASQIKSEPTDDQSASIKSADDDQGRLFRYDTLDSTLKLGPDIVASKDTKSDGNDEKRLANETSVPDAKCASPPTPTSCESRGTPKPAVKVLLRNVDLDSSREPGVPPTSTTSGSKPQEPQPPRSNSVKTQPSLSKQSAVGLEEPDHLTPKAPTPGLHNTGGQSGDVDSLVGDLDGIKLEDSSNLEDAIQRKQAKEKEAQRSPKIDPDWVKPKVSDNWSVPPTPCDK